MKKLRSLSLISLFILHGIFSMSSYGQKIFWVERSNNRIRKGDLTPTGILNITNLATGLNDPYDLSVDQNKIYIFYTEQGGVSLMRRNYNGTSPFLIRDYGAFTGYTDIAYSENANGVFGSQYTDEGGATFAAEDGSGDFSLALGAQGNDDYISVAVDDGSEIVYYINYTDDRIYSTDFSGSTATAIVAGITGLERVAVDDASGKLYFTAFSAGTNKFYSINNDGTGISTPVGLGTGTITSIQVYAKFNKVFYVKDEVIYSINLDGTGNAVFNNTLVGTGLTDIGIESDFVSPVFTALSPVDGATNVLVSANLGMTFDETVVRSTTTGTAAEKSINIYRTVGNVLVESIDRASAQIVIGTNSLTINPTTNLNYNTDHYVLIGSKVFSDFSGNNFSGITLPTGWNFTTEVDVSQYYSRQSGNYNDPNTWSHVGHSGPAASDTPGGTGTDAYIGAGHTVTMTAAIGVNPGILGLTIDPGATLNAAGFTINLNGSLVVNGTLLNGGDVVSELGASIVSSAPFLTFNSWTMGTFFPGNYTLNSNLVLLNGYTVNSGTFNQNGFQICNASVAPPVSPVFTNKKSTSVTLSWIKISTDDAFIVARQGSTAFQPNFGTAYNANAIFGSGDAVGAGNFVVYKGSDTTVNITGLTATTNYEFDMYSYSTIVGGCYSKTNYQFASVTTCGGMAPPTNPVNASYCAGDVKPAINVNSPGSGRNINWYDAPTFGNLVPGDVSGGDGRGGVFIPTAASGTFYAEIYDGTSQCTSDTRTAATLTLNPIVTPGAATGVQTVCVGDDPTVISGGTATGGDGNYTYQWESATASTTGPYTAISTATAVNYDPPAGIVLTTHYRLRVTSSTCTSQVGNFVSVTIGSPTNVTALTNTPGDAQITLNWTNPVSCFEEILIIGKQGGAPASTPVGDGTAYTANAVFGNGTAVVPGEFVVYKGTGTSVIVTGLTNSISYSFKVFTRKGIAWSAGAITSGTGVPTPPIITFVPANGSTNILVTSNLTISFNEPVRNVDNSVIDNSNVSSLLAFKLTSSSGADVPFVATINATKDAITIDPAAVLLPSQLYYLSIAPVEDSNNNASIASVITFTTQAGPSLTNITPLSVCVGQNVSITGTNFGTALPTVSINSVNIPVTAHTATSITIVPSIAASGVVTVTNMDLSLSTVSSQTLTISTLPTAFAVTGGGAYCVGGNGVAIGLTNSQAGVEYEVYLGASATGVKSIPGGGAFNFTGFFTGAGTYSVKGKNAGGCSTDMTGTAVVTINDIPSGTGSIATSATSICQGASVTLTAQGFQNALTYVWTLPAGLSTTSSTSGAAISVTGDAAPGGLVTVIARNNCGPSSPASTSITVNPLPTVSITAPPANEQILDDVLQFTSEVDIPVSSYAWDFGDGGSSADANTEHTYTSEGQFNVALIVKTAAGCEGKAGTSVSISEFPVLSSSAIKNVITANEDGKNDRLIVDNIDRFPNNTVSVLDRWGVEVHKQDAYNNDWDFKKGGNYLPAGSYVCIVKLNDSNTVITRTITLIRK